MKITTKLVKAILNSQPQYPDIRLEHDGWDMSNSSEWAQLIGKAQEKGIAVQFQESGIYMSDGRQRKIFKHPSELSNAKKFVKSLV